MKMNRRTEQLRGSDCIKLYGALVDVSRMTVKSAFAYAVSCNLDALRPLMDYVTEYFQQTEDYSKYEHLRLHICHKYAKRRNGKPLTVDGIYQISESDMPLFKAEIVQCRERYADVIEAYEARCREFAKWSDEIYEVNLCLVSIDHFPPLNAATMSGLRKIVDAS